MINQASISNVLNKMMAALNMNTVPENAKHSPTGCTYVSVSVIPAEVFPVGIGYASSDILAGIYAVTIVSPFNEGVAKCNEEAQKVINHFYKGRVQTHEDGTEVRITKASRGQGVHEGANFLTPVFVNYQSIG